MNKMFLKISGIMMVVSLTFMAPVFASSDGMQGQIDKLNSTIGSLVTRINALESQSGQKPVYVAPKEGGEAVGVMRASQDIQVSGYLDVQYSRALTDSTDHRTGAGLVNTGTNTGRIFDTDQNSFTVNSAELDFTKEANPEGGAGFRIDVQMGEDAAVVDFDPSATDSAGNGEKFSLQQAYIEYNQPLGFWSGSDILPDTVNFKVGRYVTLAGAEVIEGPDNWNISRSFAFGLSIPFTHTGIRSNFGLFNDALDVTMGVNNGWDNPVDNNTYKTLEFGLGYNPMENVSVYHAIYWGPETNNTNAHKRFLSTNVITWDITDKFSVMGEFNFGNERRSLAVGGKNTNWQSYNLYGRYQVTDKFALAYRGELFKNSDLFRTALDKTLWEQTVTAEYALADNLITRLEWRLDRANELSTFDGDSSQQTLGAQVLYLIG